MLGCVVILFFIAFSVVSGQTATASPAVTPVPSTSLNYSDVANYSHNPASTLPYYYTDPPYYTAPPYPYYPGYECFPGDAVVELESGKLEQMNKLQVGDKIRMWNGQVDEIFFFGHKLPQGQYEFLYILGQDGLHLEVSRNHLVYEAGRKRMIPASSLKVGDLLQGREGVVDRITQVKLIRKEGLYNPHTLSGAIVVNGVLASTYNSFAPPRLAHALLSLERWSYGAGFSVLGCLLEEDRPSFISWALPFVPLSSA